MSFVKLDCAIVDSSLWVERDTRSVFITALVMAEPYELEAPTPQIEVDSLAETGWVVPAGWYGLVRAAGTGIVRRDGIDMDEGLSALRALSAPDPHSRSQEYDGRRLARVNGGYLVLNYFKYRDRDYGAAERMRRLRARRKEDVTLNGTPVTANVTQAESRKQSADAKADTALRAPSWLAPICDVYERHYGAGSFPYGKAGKTLKPLHDKGHSGEEIAARFDRYAQRLDDIRFLSLAKFRESFAAFAVNGQPVKRKGGVGQRTHDAGLAALQARDGKQP